MSQEYPCGMAAAAVPSLGASLGETVVDEHHGAHRDMDGQWLLEERPLGYGHSPLRTGYHKDEGIQGGRCGAPALGEPRIPVAQHHRQDSTQREEGDMDHAR